MRLVFHVPHARSLKDKRSVVRRFRDRVRAHHPVSIAEVADQDLHQKATFGVAVVSSDVATIEGVLEAVARDAATQPEAVLTHRSTEIIPMGGDSLGDEYG